MFLTNWKWAGNGFKQEKWTIEKFSEKISKNARICPLVEQNLDTISLCFSCNFPKIPKKLLLKAVDKASWEWKIWKKKYHVIFDSHIRFDSKPKTNVWKINIRKNLGPSAAKLYNDIRRYFAKYLEIGLFSLIAESIIFRYCFCQQPY